MDKSDNSDIDIESWKSWSDASEMKESEMHRNELIWSCDENCVRQ